MKIIHIASFAGNIGDIVNHCAFYNALGIQEENVTKLEMRRFYRNCNKNKLFFDEKMAGYINTFDILVLGGGGFLDIYWEESTTGTTLDFKNGFLELIKIPVLVNAMGVFRANNSIAEKKFFGFLNRINNLPNWDINIRNDGSKKRLEQLYGKEILRKIHVVPDNAFSYNYGIEKCECKIKEDRKFIGLNVTNEIKNDGLVRGITINDYYNNIANYIKALIDYEYNVCLILHTPQDISVLGELVKYVGLETFREKVIVAPYLPALKTNQLDYIISYYRLCSLVVGMRFHSNVISIANDIPIIGLAIHEQIRDLFEENRMSEQCIVVGSDKWFEKLLEKTLYALENIDRYRINQDLVKQSILEEYDQYIKRISKYF